jgi:TPR repeat protein
MVPVRINDAVTIPFVLDSGAAHVSVPEDVFKTLLRTGTVTESDFREPGVYVTADGAERSKPRFILHEVRVGDRVVKDVVASVAPDKADPLLGQSFLGTLPGWAIDNTRHALVIGPQTATPVPPQPAAPAPTKPPLLDEAEAAYLRGDYATAASVWRSLAEQGNVVAQTMLGVLYYFGQGVALSPDVKQNDTEMARWFRKAADQGDATAQNNLGVMYEHGFGVPHDLPEAARWYRKAVEQTCAAAQNNLGVLFEDGRGVPPDYAEAARWYRKAVEQGNAFAQSNLGWLYASGRGLPQDYTEAARWFRKAADQGEPRAQFNLGVLYANGRGVPQDYAEAARWSREAADRRLALPQNGLTLLRARGTGAGPRC